MRVFGGKTDKEVRQMSNKERIIELLDSIPEYKIGYVLAYVQGVAADEEADDIFCQRMVQIPRRIRHTLLKNV